MKMKEMGAATPRKALAPSKHQVPGYCQTGCRSRAKPRESLSDQVTRLLVYLENPLLTKTEREQGLLLFNHSLRKYLAVKRWGVMR
jgi:hypothetical protein